MVYNSLIFVSPVLKIELLFASMKELGNMPDVKLLLHKVHNGVTREYINSLTSLEDNPSQSVEALDGKYLVTTIGLISSLVTGGI